MKTKQLFLFLFYLFLCAYHTQAQKRIALVIGNADYIGFERLTKPINDALDMKLALEKAGFDVYMLLDGTKQQMDDAIRTFRSKAEANTNSIRIIYYSGHGVQFDDNNYLLAAKTGFGSEADIKNNAINVQECLSLLNNLSGSNYLILDACRSLPPENIAKGNLIGKTKGLGITSLKKPNETLVAYATASGNYASDNDVNGRNSLYTQELLKQFVIPCQRFDDILKNTSNSVNRLSGQEQKPDIVDNGASIFVLLVQACSEEALKIDASSVVICEDKTYLGLKEEADRLLEKAKSDVENDKMWEEAIEAYRDAVDAACPDVKAEASASLLKAKKVKETTFLVKDLMKLEAAARTSQNEQRWDDATAQYKELIDKWKAATQKYADLNVIPKLPEESFVEAIKVCETSARRFSELKEEASNFKKAKQWDNAIAAYKDALEYQKGDKLCSEMIKAVELEKVYEANEKEYNHHIELADAQFNEKWWGKALNLYKQAEVFAKKMDEQKAKYPLEICKMKIEMCNAKVLEFKNHAFFPKFANVKGGKYLMGNITKDTLYSNEKPAHEVEIENFEMGKFEVTNAQYCLFLNEMPEAKSEKNKWLSLFVFMKSQTTNRFERCNIELIKDSAFVVKGGKNFENLPIVGVKWEGAKAYCNWLSQKTGENYSLPTEAQWEYAAKKGKSYAEDCQYAWGADFLFPEKKVANLADEEHKRDLDLSKGRFIPNYDDGWDFTCNGLTYPTNQMGIANLAGNVWEWCEDWYDKYNNQLTGNLVQTNNTGLKVIRGGSFVSTLNEARSTYRTGVNPENPAISLAQIGFRVVKNQTK